jgi:hypothetical protein
MRKTRHNPHTNTHHPLQIFGAYTSAHPQGHSLSSLGALVGRRPGTTILLTLLLTLAMCSGFSNFYFETNMRNLWCVIFQTSCFTTAALQRLLPRTQTPTN